MVYSHIRVMFNYDLFANDESIWKELVLVHFNLFAKEPVESSQKHYMICFANFQEVLYNALKPNLLYYISKVFCWYKNVSRHTNAVQYASVLFEVGVIYAKQNARSVTELQSINIIYSNK